MKTRIAWIETHERDCDGKLNKLEYDRLDLTFDEPGYCLECYTKVVVIPIEED